MNTPKGLRLHIGIFGRRNVGKSSLLNAITHQNVSIVSPEKGTTTDPVEKSMELLPLGPVHFIDTAGLDDEGMLGNLRVERTQKVYDRCDMALVVTDSDWTREEMEIQKALEERRIPWIAVLNQCDRCDNTHLLEKLRADKIEAVRTSTLTGEGLEDLHQAMIRTAPEDFLDAHSLIADLIPKNGHALLVVPIDKEAPKGRLIMPQVQTIRDLLDHYATCTICREDSIPSVLDNMKQPPNLVVTDSQAFGIVDKLVPKPILLTGFSVLFARLKGNLTSMALGAAKIPNLKPCDRVLIAEACTHHPIQDDIGRVKIPNWLRKCVGEDIQIDVQSGPDFPEDLSPYQLIIHCGACMWTRRQVLARMRIAATQNVPMTNYGLAIAQLHGILDRALEPFPDALNAYLEARN